MKTEAFHIGDNELIYVDWDKPNPAKDEIEVKAVYTGICSSDIAMFQGKFPMLPATMHGHEGVGIVTAVGTDTGEFAVGQFVATRGEPAFSRYYNCNINNAVIIPELDPKYIIEPIACAVNIGLAPSERFRDITPSRCAILGTGTLSKIIVQMFRDMDIIPDVYGSSSREYFENYGVTLKPYCDFWGVEDNHYDVVYDLTSDGDNLNRSGRVIAPNGVYVLAAEKEHTETTFSQFLWKNILISCPSPRTTDFRVIMRDCVKLIEDGTIDLAGIWTHRYSFNSPLQGFLDGINKIKGYGRGYIDFNE